MGNKKFVSRQQQLKQGEGLFTKGDIESAKKCFLKLTDTTQPPKEAYNNLGVIAFHEGNLHDAEQYFSESLAIDPNYEDAATNYAKLMDIIKQRQSVDEKIDVASPDDDAPGPHAPQHHDSLSPPRKKARIAVLCLPGLQSFLGDIVNFLKTRYEVRTIYSRDSHKLSEAVEWADIVWLEWANELAVSISRNLPAIKSKKVICRVHRYEVFRPFFKEILWQYINEVIFVARFMRDLAIKIVPDLLTRSATGVIYNGIHLERFKFTQREPGYNIAVVGYIHSRKNPYFWPFIVSELQRFDRRYTLHIAGEIQETECQLYLQHMMRKLGLEDNIQFHGYQENIHQWLESMNYLLATSVHESFGYTIGEAMAMGIRPIVHWFPGAEELWPEDNLFTSPEDAVSMIIDRDNYYSSDYRHFIENRYSLEQQLQAIDSLIEKILEEGQVKISSCIKKPSTTEATSTPINNDKDVNEKHVTTTTNNTASQTRHNDIEKSNILKKYSTDNPLALMLKEGERIADYMDLHYFLQNNNTLLSEQALFKRLQTIFHRIINSYCNSRTIQRNEVVTALDVAQRLCCMLRVENPISGNFSIETMCNLFHFLKEQLPKSTDHKTIHMQSADNVLEQASTENTVHILYQELGNTFRKLYEDRLISCFIVHGSLATLDYTLFSDIDTQVFLMDKVFERPEYLDALSQTISSANQILKAFDPLQHHGYFVSTDLDRLWYPEAYLPLNTMANGVALLGNTEQALSRRDSDYENRFSLWHTGYFFRTSYLNQSFPRTPFDMKRFLSRFSLLPVLYLELFHNCYPYKKDSFSMAADYFDSELWSVFDIIGRVRQNWNPSRLVNFNDQFYRKVFDISEIMLNRLREAACDTTKR